ncbi:MAG: DUF4290 domain-containing protein [Bacteroidales bacterium]|nr:DUF4290 domain-containing protein [Bacteroidales bacterium]
MEYNTQREKLPITDYGRNVAKLIEYAMEIDDREKRTRMAYLIVEIMALVNPKCRERADYKRTLWNHLMALSDYKLDVECPYPIVAQVEVSKPPHRLSYSSHNIHFRHYGKTLEDMIAIVSEMPDGDEKQQLLSDVAHLMKKQYLLWNRDSVDDGVIAEQLAQLSHNRLALPNDFKFNDDQFYMQNMQAGTAKRDNGSGNGNKKKRQRKKK